MRHWINSELGAANVMRVPVDQHIVEEFLPLSMANVDENRFTCTSPPWNSDIRWISAATEEAFELFQSAFERLGIAKHVEPYVDFQNQIRLYAGFIVLRSMCTAPSFHHDWIGGNNDGFNFIAPITANTERFGLLYKKLNGKEAEYEYRTGEGIIIGDHFEHSTAPGRSDDPVALLSFTFGTDKMEHWERLARTAGRQGSLVRLPDGTFHRTG
jgi:hypothetical protein